MRSILLLFTFLLVGVLSGAASRSTDKISNLRVAEFNNPAAANPAVADGQPTGEPSSLPTGEPTFKETEIPTATPTTGQEGAPSLSPTFPAYSSSPMQCPSGYSTAKPTEQELASPSLSPTLSPQQGGFFD
jgi:hypothetical protein